MKRYPTKNSQQNSNSTNDNSIIDIAYIEVPILEAIKYSPKESF